MGTDTEGAALAQLLADAVALRRDLHAHPEPGFEEKETQQRIMGALAKMADLKITRACAETGLVCDITGGRAGVGPAVAGEPAVVKTVALRADMDALRMTERNEGLPHRSQNEGVAHMCGHDGHMASLVLAAALIARRRDRLPAGSGVRLLFQPAEEGPGGALPMLMDGALDGVGEIYGFHNWPTFPVGRCHVKSGALMAHVAEFEIVVRGAGCHASQPHAGVDAVLVASSVVVALHSIVARSAPSSANCVVSVTCFHAGEATNVLPDTATLKGTIRDLDPDVYDILEKRIRAIVAGTCAAHGASADVKIDGMYPVVMNHHEQTAIVERVAAETLGAPASSEGLPMLGAEDFAYFLDPKHGGVPGCFFFLGGREEEVGGLAAFDPTVPGAFAGKDGALRRSNCMCHGTAYDFNDNVIPGAAAMYVRLVETRLGCSLYGPGELDALA